MELEVIIIIVLAVLVIFLVGDRLRGRDRLREQADALSRVVG